MVRVTVVILSTNLELAWRGWGKPQKSKSMLINQFYSDIKKIYLPELASPADIELLTVGESVSKSLSIDAARLRGSSKFKSSNALPVK